MRKRSINLSALLVCLCGFTLSSMSWAESSSLPTVVAKIKPGIVAVGTLMEKRSPRAQFLGTGFAIGDGSLVVTNAHVLPTLIDEAHLEQIAVFRHQNNVDKAILAHLVALDIEHDVAILKLTGDKLEPLKLANADSVLEGQLYAFTGYPMGMMLGLYPVTHRALISAISPNAIPSTNAEHINPKMLKRLQNPYTVFQLDATAYPGNSGSPLYDTETGAVIGIVNKVFVQESKENVLAKPSGISYAIPANHIEKLLNAKNLK